MCLSKDINVRPSGSDMVALIGRLRYVRLHNSSCLPSLPIVNFLQTLGMSKGSSAASTGRGGLPGKVAAALMLDASSREICEMEGSGKENFHGTLKMR